MEVSNSFAFPLCDELPVGAQKDASSTKLKVLHEAKHKVFTPVMLTSACGIPEVLSGTHWKCHHTVVFYRCNTLEGKNLSGAKHGGTALRCFRCLINKKDISSLRKAKRRLKAEMEVAYNSHKNFLNTADALHRRGMKAGAQIKRALLYLALDQYSLNKV